MTDNAKISRKAAVQAAHDGGQARRDGKTVADCPFSPTGDLVERFQAHYWRKGYAAQLRVEQTRATS